MKFEGKANVTVDDLFDDIDNSIGKDEKQEGKKLEKKSGSEEVVGGFEFKGDDSPEKVEARIRAKVTEEFVKRGVKNPEGQVFEQIIADRTTIELERIYLEKSSDEQVAVESAKIAAKRNKLLTLIEQKKKRIDMDRLKNLFCSTPEEFAAKTMILPSYVEWAKKREAAGLDVDILVFIKDESNITGREFDIIIDEFEKYDEKDEPINASPEGLIKKGKISEELRKAALLLTHISGTVDANVFNAKEKKWAEEFEKWLNRNLERAGTTFQLWSNGLAPLGWMFEKFWNGQGKIDKLKAKMTKERMGEIEHVVILQKISQRAEEIVALVEKSENCKEVKHYLAELKECLSMLVKWDNEYKRLYGDRNSDVNEALDKLMENSRKMEELMIIEMHPESATKIKEQMNKFSSEQLADKQAAVRVFSGQLIKNREYAEFEIAERTNPAKSPNDMRRIPEGHLQSKFSQNIEYARRYMEIFPQIMENVTLIEKTDKKSEMKEYIGKIKSLLATSAIDIIDMASWDNFIGKVEKSDLDM